MFIVCIYIIVVVTLSFKLLNLYRHVLYSYLGGIKRSLESWQITVDLESAVCQTIRIINRFYKKYTDTSFIAKGENICFAISVESYNYPSQLV